MFKLYKFLWRHCQWIMGWEGAAFPVSWPSATSAIWSPILVNKDELNRTSLNLKNNCSCLSNATDVPLLPRRKVPCAGSFSRSPMRCLQRMHCHLLPTDANGICFLKTPNASLSEFQNNTCLTSWAESSIRCCLLAVCCPDWPRLSSEYRERVHVRSRTSCNSPETYTQLIPTLPEPIPFLGPQQWCLGSHPRGPPGATEQDGVSEVSIDQKSRYSKQWIPQSKSHNAPANRILPLVSFSTSMFCNAILFNSKHYYYYCYYDYDYDYDYDYYYYYYYYDDYDYYYYYY